LEVALGFAVQVSGSGERLLSKHGLLKHPQFGSMIFPARPLYIEDFQLPRLIAGGYIQTLHHQTIENLLFYIFPQDRAFEFRTYQASLLHGSMCEHMFFNFLGRYIT